MSAIGVLVGVMVQNDHFLVQYVSGSAGLGVWPCEVFAVVTFARAYHTSLFSGSSGWPISCSNVVYTINLQFCTYLV
jgi:hypothetical protein